MMDNCSLRQFMSTNNPRKTQISQPHPAFTQWSRFMQANLEVCLVCTHMSKFGTYPSRICTRTDMLLESVWERGASSPTTNCQAYALTERSPLRKLEQVSGNFSDLHQAISILNSKVKCNELGSVCYYYYLSRC
jgi:hypothetical protein